MIQNFYKLLDTLQLTHPHGFYRKSMPLLASALLAWPSMGLSTAESITIESDHAQYYFQKGMMHHKDNVVVHWQNKILHADELKLYKAQDGKINKLTAFGNPTVMQGSLADGSEMIAKANEVEYNPITNTLILKDKAELNHQHNIFLGPKITLNLDTNSVVADKDENTRPKLVFDMSKETS